MEEWTDSPHPKGRMAGHSIPVTTREGGVEGTQRQISGLAG